MFECKRCNKEYNKYQSLRSHVGRTHKIKSPDFYVEFYYNGKWPLCTCGCKGELRFEAGKFPYKYLHGHHIKAQGGFWTSEGIKKSIETNKKKRENGELQPWNKNLTKETDERVAKHAKNLTKKNNPKRAKKISDALKGKKKSPEHIEKIKKDRQEYWGKQENRDAQRMRRSKYIKENQTNKPSKLELEFKSMLKKLKIKHIVQYRVNGYCYDFFIKDTSILIEVDGDFWHCNPQFYKEPLYEVQKHNMKHDQIKNKNATESNYTLLRFWEHDIKNNPKKVVKTLLETL